MLICFSINLVQIIDSIMALFRVDFSGRGELAERQQKLAQMLSRLQKISEGRSQSSSGCVGIAAASALAALCRYSELEGSDTFFKK